MATPLTTAPAASDVFEPDSGFFQKSIDAVTLAWTGGKNQYFAKGILTWTAAAYFIIGAVFGNVWATRTWKAATAAGQEPSTWLGMSWSSGIKAEA